MTPLQLAGSAFVVGLSGAMMPGPVLTVTITEAPRHGWITGLLISVGHGVAELVLVVALYLGASQFISRSAFSSVIGVVGGLVLLVLGGQMTLRGLKGNVGLGLEPADRRSRPHGPALLGGVTTLSNPYWYLWWATVGTAYMVQAMRHSYVGVASFFCGHISADIAWYSLVSIALVFGKRVISDSVYRGLLGVCGVFLVGLGVYFVRFGLSH